MLRKLLLVSFFVITFTVLSVFYIISFRYNPFFFCFGCTFFQSILDVAKGVVPEGDFCEMCEVGYFNFSFTLN